MPIRYVLSSGGKRLRAILTLLGCEAVGGNALRAIEAAAAIEMLHNFTLVHDDVMDNALLRRNRQTVHTKWDANVAILAGDEHIALAYEALLRTNSKNIHAVTHVFTNAFIEVCEGQGFDKEFERRGQVTVGEYRRMIKKKTARVISAAVEIGALIGEGTPRQASALRTFGEHLGMAFQINDDLLDITGDEKEFGKTIGGDIVEKKKTFLFVTALERARGKDRALLLSVPSRKQMNRNVIDRVRSVYERCGALETAQNAVKRHTMLAQRALSPLGESRSTRMLYWLSDELLYRKH